MGHVFLIFGLGNPETEYQLTRHNLGHLVIDKLAHNYGISLEIMKNKSLLHTYVSNDNTIHLVKPMCGYNDVGIYLEKCIQELHPTKCIVIHDDIRVALGKYKISKNRMHKGNNGIKSILQSKCPDIITYISIGIGSNYEEGKCMQHVLGDFTTDELRSIPYNDIFKSIETIQIE